MSTSFSFLRHEFVDDNNKLMSRKRLLSLLFFFLDKGLAKIVQQPYRKTGKMPTLAGNFGIGKGIFTDWLISNFFGAHHATKIVGFDNLTQRFTSPDVSLSTCMSKT